jgi:hypothetical protein
MLREDGLNQPSQGLRPRLGRKGIQADAPDHLADQDFSVPPREIMMKALDVWTEVGLPKLTIPKPAQLRIDRS